MIFKSLDRIDVAQEKFQDNFKKFKLEQERIRILDSLDRILAEEIKSPINIPEFNRSTKDGYAIFSEDSKGATKENPRYIQIIGEVKMGERTNLKVYSGRGVYVPTGGMIPDGADSVIMIEYIENQDSDKLALYKEVSSKENIIFKGQDMKEGELLFDKGRRIKPQDIGTFASIGKTEVNIYKKPRFYIISTGDEIVDIHKEVGDGKIRDINGYSLSAEINKIEGEVVDKTIVKDDFDLLKKETKKAIGLSDIVLISGGSSVGVKDYTYKVIEELGGEVFVHGVLIKPGKPTIIAKVKDKIVIGLPGHPTSTLIVFKVFVEDFLRNKFNIEYGIAKTKAIIAEDFKNNSPRETYQMVRLEEKDNKLYGTANIGTSGMIYLLSKSQGYVIIKPEEDGLKKGEVRDIYFI